MSRAMEILEMVVGFLPEDVEEEEMYDLDSPTNDYNYMDRGPHTTPRRPDGKKPAGLATRAGFSS